MVSAKALVIVLVFLSSLDPRAEATNGSCTVAYPDLARAGNNGVIRTSTQVVIPQAAFTGCGRITEWDMLASCSGGRRSIVLQVWTPDSEQDLTYHLRSSELVTQASGCSLTSPITFSGFQNLTFQPGDVPGMYVLPSNEPFLEPGYVRLDNDHRGALSDDIDHYLEMQKNSVVEEVTFNTGENTMNGAVPLISIKVSGCSCTSGNGNPGNGSGNTGNGNENTGDGNGSTADGGAIAAGVIVVLLVAAIATGGVIVGIFLWRRRSANRVTSVKHADMQTSVLYLELTATIEGHYWLPGFKEEEIYQQMASHHYQEFDGECIEVLNKLGEGQFGEVYKAVLKTPTGTSQDVAVKVVKKGAPQEERLKLLQEAAILGQFRHRHVVDLKGIVRDELAMVVMELLEGGDLLDCLRRMQQQSERKRSVMEPDLPTTLLKFCRQVAEGLSYLAGKSFVHRDIAARNILLDKELNCKLSGFGMTRDLSEEDYSTITVGERLFMKWTAPEVLFYKKYSTSSDVWSYGMLMYEIWSLGHAPFGDSQPKQVVKLLKERYCQPPPPGCPRAVYAIMVDCWHPDPHCRPAASSLCSSLNQPEADLLFWDQSTPTPSSSAHILGAPLEEGHKLYGELQSIYQDYI